MSEFYSGKDLTPRERRQLQRLQPAVERAVASDTQFFASCPQRRHLIRKAHPAEVAQQEIVDHQVQRLAPGLGWFAVVKQVLLGVMVRALTANRDDDKIDASETLAAMVFEAAWPDHDRVQQPFAGNACGQARHRSACASFSRDGFPTSLPADVDSTDLRARHCSNRIEMLTKPTLKEMVETMISVASSAEKA